MSIHDPTPFNMAMIMILKEDLHYIQRAARRAKNTDTAFLHNIIEKHRYSGG